MQVRHSVSWLYRWGVYPAENSAPSESIFHRGRWAGPPSSLVIGQDPLKQKKMACAAVGSSQTPRGMRG